MNKRLIPSAIISIVLNMPLLCQTDYEYSITINSNKIVMLGAMNANDTGKWKQIIDSDGVYGHGFVLIERMIPTIRTNNPKFFEAFGEWFRQRYGLSADARWAALDIENRLIVTGVQTPSVKEFEEMLDQRGIKSPSRQLRDFLRENPDHLDAMTDLLKEVRRRALHVMPPNTTEELDIETDLRTWGVLAAETDKVFNVNWLGIEPGFFMPDQIPPERFSKLMKNVFHKNISKVESAIQLEPANYVLWNIWAWMASSLSDYKWIMFVNSFEPVVLQVDFNSTATSIPSSEVSAWIVAKACGEKDWATVIKFAPVAKWFSKYLVEEKDEWMPGGDGWSASFQSNIKGYPEKSAYAPLLEALLRTGDIDGANVVFDEMLRLDSFTTWSEKAAIAAEVAKSAGMDDLAALWGKGEPFNRVSFEPRGEPWFLVFRLRNDEGRVYDMQFSDMQKSINWCQIRYADGLNLAKIGWKIEDGGRWALISADGHVLTQDSAIPSLDEMQSIFDRFNIKNKLEIYKKYISDNGSSPGIELSIAFEIYDNFRRIAESLDSSQNEKNIAEFAWYLSKVMREHPDALVYLPRIYLESTAPSRQSELLKSLSKPMLANIELLLQNKPSSSDLWYQWIFWKNIEGNERSLESMVESVKLSPLSKIGTVPPHAIINRYYEECKKNGSWPKVIGLLKTAWDREFSRLSHNLGFWSVTKVSDIGDRLGTHLIEAYLHGNKPGEANEIFNAVLGLGGRFTDISKLLDLAKEKGQERLAREWGERVKK